MNYIGLYYCYCYPFTSILINDPYFPILTTSHHYSITLLVLTRSPYLTLYYQIYSINTSYNLEVIRGIEYTFIIILMTPNSFLTGPLKKSPLTYVTHSSDICKMTYDI